MKEISGNFLFLMLRIVGTTASVVVAEDGNIRNWRVAPILKIIHFDMFVMVHYFL